MNLENTEAKNTKETELKPSEIYSFNLWSGLTCGYIFFVLLTFIPNKYFVKYLKIDFLPERYWYNALPLFVFVSVVVLFFLIKSLELISTIDHPPYIDDYTKILSKHEMQKEINYDKKEGILPDMGDLPEEIVNKVLNYKDI